jgi:uncharacterized GH25 family protein
MKRFPLAAAAILVPALAQAHDFWIEPSTFRPSTGQNVSATLRVGQKLEGDTLPRIPPLIERFGVWGSEGEIPLDGAVGEDPAGFGRIAREGQHWLLYQSNPYPVALDARKFEEYLRDEGLESIIEARAKAGQAAAPGRERFYRCAKALLDGKSSSGVATKAAGLTLELVPEKNPYAVHLGGTLPVSLLFHGKPIANVLVVAMSKGDPDHSVRARTDSKGRVVLKLARSGFWLVKAVHMERAPAGAGADWQSWWASLTFDLPGNVTK